MYRLIALKLFILSIISYSCGQSEQTNTVEVDYEQWRQNYIKKPKSKDTLCISDINRAKKDIANGKIVFTQEYGFMYGDIRYENELRKLCNDVGLVFDFDLISDVVFEGQTQGCYGAYMSRIIADKYGSDFKEKLHHKADSLFLINVNKQNKIIQYWDCDKRARLPNEEKRTNDDIPSISIKELDIKEDNSEYGGWPFIDLRFIVEKDSTLSHFRIREWVPHLETNEKFKDSLFIIAIDNMKDKFPKWVPGEISGVPVRTDNNVRVFFVKE